MIWMDRHVFDLADRVIGQVGLRPIGVVADGG